MAQEALEFSRRNSLFTMVENGGRKRQGEIAIRQAVFRYKETRIPGRLARFEDSIEKIIESCNGNTKAELQLAIPQKEPHRSARIKHYVERLSEEIEIWAQQRTLEARSRSTGRNLRKFGSITPLPPHSITLEFTHQIIPTWHDMRKKPEDPRKTKRIEIMVVHLTWEYRTLAKETEENVQS